jgi:hypothetical protein
MNLADALYGRAPARHAASSKSRRGGTGLPQALLKLAEMNEAAGDCRRR